MMNNIKIKAMQQKLKKKYQNHLWWTTKRFKPCNKNYKKRTKKTHGDKLLLCENAVAVVVQRVEELPGPLTWHTHTVGPAHKQGRRPDRCKQRRRSMRGALEGGGSLQYGIV